jgi:hypothetical protein
MMKLTVAFSRPRCVEPTVDESFFVEYWTNNKGDKENGKYSAHRWMKAQVIHSELMACSGLSLMLQSLGLYLGLIVEVANLLSTGLSLDQTHWRLLKVIEVLSLRHKIAGFSP